MKSELSIGLAIRKLQACQRGVSNLDIAKQCRVQPEAVSRWRNDKTRPTLDQVAAMAYLFDVKMSELIAMGES